MGEPFSCAEEKKMSSQILSVDTKRGREPGKRWSSPAETRFTSKEADGEADGVLGYEAVNESGWNEVCGF